MKDLAEVVQVQKIFILSNFEAMIGRLRSEIKCETLFHECFRKDFGSK